jgi:DNA invertase Pin-like site-specific DNA recombinase
MLETCMKRGLTVQIPKQGMVLDGSMQSRITATVLGLAAEIERELISQRASEALARRKAAGKPLGRPKGRHGQQPEARSQGGGNPWLPRQGYQQASHRQAGRVLPLDAL